MAKIDVFRAARRYCLSCQGESAAAVRSCADTDCPLWEWRLPTPPTAGHPPCQTAGHADALGGTDTDAAGKDKTGAETASVRVDGGAAGGVTGGATGSTTGGATSDAAGNTADGTACTSEGRTAGSACGGKTALGGETALGRGAEATQTSARVPFAPNAARTALRRRLLRVIRRQCLACAGHRKDVRQCAAKECELWHLRFGVMPETYRAVRNRFFAPKPLSLF